MNAVGFEAVATNLFYVQKHTHNTTYRAFRVRAGLRVCAEWRGGTNAVVHVWSDKRSAWIGEYLATPEVIRRGTGRDLRKEPGAEKF